jgi:hypothetical protein
MTCLLIEIASYIMGKQEPQYIHRKIINCTFNKEIRCKVENTERR